MLDIISLKFLLSPFKREPIKALAAGPSTEHQLLGPVPLLQQVSASKDVVPMASEVSWLGCGWRRWRRISFVTVFPWRKLLFLERIETLRVCHLVSVSQCSGRVRDF